jgi:Transposase IS66 family
MRDCLVLSLSLSLSQRRRSRPRVTCSLPPFIRKSVPVLQLAMILFEKFGQHQPLNRQSERYRCEGIDLSVSTLADQVGACTTALRPLHALIERHVLAAAGGPAPGAEQGRDFASSNFQSIAPGAEPACSNELGPFCSLFLRRYYFLDTYLIDQVLALQISQMRSLFVVG